MMNQLSSPQLMRKRANWAAQWLMILSVWDSKWSLARSIGAAVPTWRTRTGNSISMQMYVLFPNPFGRSAELAHQGHKIFAL